ncbi:hypothetical protein ACFL5K_02940 [Gemmatimonadota bacterium]
MRRLTDLLIAFKLALIPGIITKRKLIDKLRLNWGRELDEKRDFNLIAIYHRLARGESETELVDDKTWQDLDMEEIFMKIDRNVSSIGRQYLYHRLRRYEKDLTALSDLTDYYNFFLSETKLREDVQVILNRLSSDKASFVPFLFLDSLPEKPALHKLIYISSFITVISSVLLFYHSYFVFVLLVLGLINIAFNVIFGKKIYEHFTGLCYLNVMLGAAISISELEAQSSIPALDYLRKHRSSLKRMKKSIGWLVIDKSKLGDLAEAGIEYLNLICLFDLVAFYRSIDHLLEHRSELAKIYNAVAALDFYISTASYLSSLPSYCVPVSKQNQVIDFNGVYHPMLGVPVANSFSLQDKSALITGSNMAGKTTFIKTVGVNVILGRTLHICLAEKAVIPRLSVRTSITRSENLDEGKSYFFEEVETLLKFIRGSDAGRQSLFLIDEIYRGTNTTERIASAMAVLRHLGECNIVLVTTHDIELQDLLKDSFDMYHFCEQVEGDRFYFDYKIKKGPTLSRNAIKLLELCGYPEKIISEASSQAHKRIS